MRKRLQILDRSAREQWMRRALAALLLLIVLPLATPAHANRCGPGQIAEPSVDELNEANQFYADGFIDDATWQAWIQAINEAAPCALCPSGTVPYNSSPLGGPNPTPVTCTLCDQGSMPSPDQSQCVACAAGSYSTFKNPVCTACPDGTFSNAGAASCTACPTGTVSIPDRTICLAKCPAGYEPTGEHSCRHCPAGTISKGGDGKKCHACVNSTVPNGNHAACICVGLTKWNSQHTGCVPCPAHQVPTDSHHLACKPCPSGTHFQYDGCVTNPQAVPNHPVFTPNILDNNNPGLGPQGPGATGRPLGGGAPSRGPAGIR